MLLEVIGVRWEGVQAGGERKHIELEWSTGCPARASSCVGGLSVTPGGWAKALLLTSRAHAWAHGGPRTSHLGQAELSSGYPHHSWHFCLKEISEPTVAIFLPFHFPEGDFWTQPWGLLFTEQGLSVAISGNSSIPRHTRSLLILVLIEITCQSLPPLIQGSISNWAIALKSFFLSKIIQRERDSKKSWRLHG